MVRDRYIQRVVRMNSRDIERIVDDIVAEAMLAQDSFALSAQEAHKHHTGHADIKQLTEGCNARTLIAIWAELKGIRAALTVVAQLIAHKK
ncbi:hypothetical protein DXU07_45725 [Bradyrhizobium elkanii]|nr:hypothetical protein BLN97_10115 [Bradyrhizobium elkanii]